MKPVLVHEVKDLDSKAVQKFVTREALIALCGELRLNKKRIAFTSGVFDLLHRGHAEYLESCKDQCNILIVGVNSDTSVKQNKGELRPIVGERDRAFLVAALACVDYVFIFDERNNNENVRTLKPDLYLKADDYNKQKMSSASIVEAYGGKVGTVAFSPGFSSSALIDKITTGTLGLITSSIAMPPYEKRPAVVLDRDGTINESVEYLGEPEKFKFIAGAVEAIKKFNDLGYRVVVLTNQPGIGMGYFSQEDFYRVTRVMLKGISAAGGKIDRIYFCPHNQAEDCDCRKPKTALLDRAIKDLNLDIKGSFVIGDTTLDIQLAKNVGFASVLVETGQGGKDANFEAKPDYVATDLLAAADFIAGRFQQKK